ncbi:tripartite tricarboxylate transporter permease [Gammaproteobacteria bacterium]|nr:tripartite tricarboxylate transporter permease [Gammaproteobacteria bacterium]
MLEGFQLMLANSWIVPVGVVIGILVGAMPGLTSSGTLSLLLPILLVLPSEIALMLGVCIYAGAEMGNSFPSVMLNIPGTPGGAVTCLDGYPMMLKGEAARALGICIMASTIGGLVGSIAAIALTPNIAKIALHFGPVEICIVVLFGLTTIARLSSDGMARGLLAGFFGLLLATTGTDPTYGQQRGTFNIVYLFDQLPVVAALIGLLGFSEVLMHAEKHVARLVESVDVHAAGPMAWRGIRQGFRDVLHKPSEWIRASLIGLGIGAMPGAGASVATFVAYQQSHAFASPERKQEFGKGAHEGLIAADASNNAVVGGALVPLLTLGIPGSGSMAVLLVVMSYHGLAAGPTLFTFNADTAYAILWSLFFASGFVLAIGTILAWFAWRIAMVNLSYMVPVISVFCLLGAFTRNGYVFDMGVMLAFGVLGYIMKKYRYPVVAMLLGIVLGPLFEENFMRSWRMGFGEFDVFWESQTALYLWGLFALTLVGPSLVRCSRRVYARITGR